MKKAIAKSSLGHILVFLLPLMLLNGTGNGGKSKEAGDQNGNGRGSQDTNGTIKPPEVLSTELVEPKEGLKGKDLVQKKKALKNKHKKPDCQDWYGGVGVTQDWSSHALTSVVEGYPAYFAGLEVGDIILPGSDEMRGDVGARITLHVQKLSGDVVTVYLTREKICTEGT